MNPIQKDAQMEGKIAFITGAGSGLGRAFAHAFAASGATVAATDVAFDRVAGVVSEITGLGGKAIALRLDVSSKQEIALAVAETAARFGQIDIVVNNAGVPAFARFDDEKYDEVWNRAIAINLTAYQVVVRAALPHLRTSKSPRIVNIASVEGLGASPDHSGYCATKAGVIGLTRAMAVELGREGITVNCVCPGPIDTDMTGFVSAEDKVIFAKRRTVLRRYGRPEEVAHMVLSLAHPNASYVTGSIIAVDGGLTARNS
ncbi:MAG: 3-oxoacyl-[ACP] reductase [Hydrocarboniphaga sp.]|uniref:SDR family NAD(P)-dependent oxidoreductase n=1 Tax=Hydrocarboniphaga sp. TaxID=2033016 RepID=UPI0026396BF6|nr:SDR family NAD(P)-dependent oxidoreductase [Hydrocarboniphaga sp.]MDB5971169.1 3-oxoacyl-[ACP] reductase [Hydrocarboniphaga sp.]